MKSISRGFFLTIIAMLLLTGGVRGEDIDLYSPGSGSTAKPNVLVIIDSSSNWTNAFLPNSATLPTCGPSVTSTNDRRSKFCSEIQALMTVINTLDQNIRLGLMMFNETGANGAYVRFAIRDMTPANKQALINLLNNLVFSGSGTDNSGSNQPYGKAMFEAFKYFGGYTDPAHASLDQAGSPANANNFGPTAYAGTDSTGSFRRDYFDNATPANRSARAYGADANSAFASSSSRTYISPITDACAKNYILFISNGNPSTGGDSSGAGSEQPASTLLANINPTTTQLGSPEIHASKADEFAKYLNLTDVSPLTGQQNVITYTMAVYAAANNSSCIFGSDISNTDCAMVALMKSMASAGGGTYYPASNADQLKIGFDSFFADVQAVNSVFVSSSLPVSVNTQGTYLNQVYMGMFRPDADARARWVGNLKEYKFTYSSATGELKLADSTGADAINPSTGFIKPTGVSYWTTAQTDNGTITPFNFWVNSPSGSPTLTMTQKQQDSPDGDIVDKGGAAQKLRTANLTATARANRKVYTCPTTGCSTGLLSNFAFNTTNITGATYETAFGASTAELPTIVDWVRGTDNAGNEAAAGPGTVGTTDITVRPSVHGDVLHSRPVLVNYAATGAVTDDVVGFYGANDGTLRAIQAGQGAGSGAELWAFIAPESFGKFRRLRATVNSPPTALLQIPSPSSGKSPAVLPDSTGVYKPKDYFFDGTVTSYEERNGSGALTKVYLYIAARRGGNYIYALDVTDRNAPRFLWSKSTQSGGNFSSMALTFSAPLVGKVKGNANPVLFFGGGYYGGYNQASGTSNGQAIGEDADPAAACPGSGVTLSPALGCGNRIFVVDAFTGTEIHSFPSGSDPAISKGVAADVSLVDSDGDGYVDRVYAVDVGGGVWRMDVDNALHAQWKLFNVANVTSPRKFLYAPEFVLTRNFTAVLVGSGDREKPLKNTGVDRFYMFKDKKTSKDATGMVAINGDDTASNNMVNVTGQSSPPTSAVITALASPANMGWFYEFAAGEKVVNAPLVAGPVVYFSTNKPTPVIDGTCTANLGEAKAYGLLFTNGTPGRDTNADGIFSASDAYVVLPPLTGLPPSPVGGLVNVLDSATNTSVIVPFIIGSGGTSAPPNVGTDGTPGAPCTGSGCIVCPIHMVPSSIGGSMVCLQPDPRRKKSYWYFKSDQ